MLTLLLALVSPAEAACPAAPCVDVDGDNYCPLDPTNCPSANDRSDCDDSDITINPNAVEVGYDQVDQDCDSKDGISRKYVDDFTNNAAGDWTPTGGVTWPGDTVVIPGTNNIQLSADFEHLRGTPHVVLDVESLTGSCTLKLTAGGPPTGTTGAITTTQSIAATGTQVFYFSASLVAPLIVTEIMVSCTAGNSVALDWLSVQDGTLEWPPAADMNLSWGDTSLPAGGASNVVLVGADDGLYAGSDEGGVYWFDGTDWMTLNGVDVDLWAAYDQAAWDVLPVDEDSDGIVDTIYTLTGDTYGSSIYGGLWYTADGGVSWTEALDQDDGIAAYARIHPCDDDFDDDPARAGGHLLARDATSETLYVGSHAVGDEGVYMVEEATLTSCALSGLPAGSLPSALAFGENGSGDTLLLVGLKGDDGSTDESVYYCEVPTNADCTTNTVSCTAVSDADAPAIDVRDIQVDVLDPTVAYLADGGRFDASGSCTFSDGAVWEWDIAGDTLADVTDNLDPPIDGNGNVLDVAGEVVGISMDSDGDYLFAYFPGSQDLPYTRGTYGTASNAKAWRAAMSTLGTGGSNDWDGLQGTDSNAHSDRRVVVGGIDYLATSTADLWIDDQLGRETWAPAYAVDGIFWDDDANAGTPDVMMVTDGFGIWLVDGTIDASWADVDDDVGWTYWFDSGNTENLPQTTVASGTAEGPSGVVYSTFADIGAGWWDGSRGAEVPCYFDRLNAHGRAVDSPGESASGDIVWMAMGRTKAPLQSFIRMTGARAGASRRHRARWGTAG